MSFSAIFSVGNLAVLAGWICLVFLPFWRGTQIIAAVVIPFLLGLAYISLLSYGMTAPDGPPLDFGSIEGVRTLFSADSALVAGWLHYLAFDLFIGAWEVRDSRQHGIPHWFVVPCLALTFMFGPVGLVLYLVIRMARLKTVEITP